MLGIGQLKSRGEGMHNRIAATRTWLVDAFMSSRDASRISGCAIAALAACACVTSQAHAASIEQGSVAASEASSSAITLAAAINPEGLATRYVFVYAKSGESLSSSGAARLPLGEGSVGEGANPVAVSVNPQDLQDSTTYHFELIATSPGAPTEQVVSSESSFTTFSDAGGFVLPDGRAWELVTPPDKEGAGVKPSSPEGVLIEASEGGEAFTYGTSAPTGEAEGNRALETVQNLASRGTGGWSSQSIATRNSTLGELVPGSTSEYKMFTGSLSEAVVSPTGETPLTDGSEAEGYEKTIYLRNDFAQPATFTPLVTKQNVSPGARFGQLGRYMQFQGASADLRHEVFASPEALTPEVAASSSGFEQNLYEWTAGATTSQQLQLVSVLPDGHPATEPGGSGTPEGASLGHTDKLVRNAVSADGTRVVWQTTGFEEHLFLRDTLLHETVQLDVAQEGVEPPLESRPVFQGASSDGSRIFFTDTARLTADSHAKTNSPDLYVAEVVPGAHLAIAITDVTKDTNGVEPTAVRGLILGYSAETGENVYYVANGKLKPNAIVGECGEGGSPGTFCNLYESHAEDGTWTTTLLGVLSIADWTDWGGRGEGSPAGQTARVSPNGQYLAFMSQQPLTGYDNEDLTSRQPDQEVFLFDSATSGVRCVSCNPAGTRPQGLVDPAQNTALETPLVDQLKLWAEKTLAASIPGWTPNGLEEALYQPRYLSNSGRVFFDAADALVPADTNRKEDVYEYEPEGAAAGQCSASTQSGAEVYVSAPEVNAEATGGSPLTHGCVGLLSSGTSNEESIFLDASENGENVFLLTQSQLSAKDQDHAFDVYDAHVCSASVPCPTESLSVPPVCSTPESCRHEVSAPPPVGALASEVIAGGGESTTVLNTAPKAPTNAEKLATALKACKKLKAGKKRTACEGQAVDRYGTNAQKLTRALKACKTKAVRRQRSACEVKARRKYKAHTSSRGRKQI
jgi:hypothetical protein